MQLTKEELQGIAVIAKLKDVGEIREDSYKKAVMHSYNAAIHLFNEGYYPAAIQNIHICADMAVKLFLWKKHLVNYTDYHNLPMVRMLHWLPQQEEMKQTITDLRRLHQLYEQFGDYMEMVEEYPEHLFSTEKNDLFAVDTSNNKKGYLIQAAVREAILLLDKNLKMLLM